MRDANYMCEAITRDAKPLWTINGGYCLPFSLAYQTLRLDTTADTDTCTFSLKCALSGSLDQDCECKNTTSCSIMITKLCANPYLLYPGSGALPFPYAYMVYAREHDWTNKKSQVLLYFGRVKCVGYQLITNGARFYALKIDFSLNHYGKSEYTLCSMLDGTESFRNYSGPRYDANCWKNSKTFNNRSFQVSSLCEKRCISKYRIRDGIVDCYPPEELYTTNNSCPQIQHHRLQCSPSELTCLPVGALGNWDPACSNGRDEFDFESNSVFINNLICQHRTDPGCLYLRRYISSSSSDNTDKTVITNNILDDHSTTAIPFRSYCNSFFDTLSGIDESPQFCKKWVCLSDEYQCLSGQCISQSWVCDGKLTLLVILILTSMFLLVLCR
jgi:hypothetical protein